MSTVVVLGASDNPERTAFQALNRLLENHHEVIPVNPKGGEILGRQVQTSLAAIKKAVDTVTLYVGPDRQAPLIEEIVTLKPRRVIFNPGTENPAVYSRLQQAGIDVQQACTLVLLATHQFE